jgi:hypothetical protein
MPYLRPVSLWRVFRAVDPAVATDWTVSVPGSATWRVYGVRFDLVADANVANRTAQLVADDQTSEIYRIAFDATVTAGLTARFSAYAGGTRNALLNGAANVGLPTDGLVLLPGYRLRLVSAGLQAGDQYSAVSLQVQEYPVGPDQEWTPGVDTLVSTVEG